MARYPVDWVDAFSDRPFGGNGCAVVHDAGGLDAATCMAFVRETGLVECTFVEASGLADFRVRYFVAAQEIPFAGHPTVATAASLLARGLVGAGPLTLETGAGVLPVTVQQAGRAVAVTMRQARPVFGPQADPGEIAAIYGLAARDVIGVPQVTSTGLPFTVTVLASLDALRRAVLNADRLRAYTARLGEPDGFSMEPYLVVREGADAEGDTFARLLLLPPSPPEDPFTGSATGAAAAYLWHHGLIDRPAYVAQQGHWMGRPGQAEVRVLGPRAAPEGVEVSGMGYVLMSGELQLA